MDENGFERHESISVVVWSQAMVKMFHGCHLVHADLSEYNILWHEEQCWIIDLGQAVEPTHPHALHFLHRDCSNVIRWVDVFWSYKMEITSEFKVTC